MSTFYFLMLKLLYKLDKNCHFFSISFIHFEADTHKKPLNSIKKVKGSIIVLDHYLSPSITNKHQHS